MHDRRGTKVDTVELLDGRVVSLRRLGGQDADALLALNEHLPDRDNRERTRPRDLADAQRSSSVVVVPPHRRGTTLTSCAQSACSPEPVLTGAVHIGSPGDNR